MDDNELKRAAIRIINQFHRLKREKLEELSSRFDVIKRNYPNTEIIEELKELAVDTLEEIIGNLSKESVSIIKLFAEDYIRDVEVLNKKVKEYEKRLDDLALITREVEKLRKENKELREKVNVLSYKGDEKRAPQVEILRLKEELKEKNVLLKRFLLEKPQFRVIDVLEKEGPLTPVEIAAQMGKTENTIKKYIAYLEDKGFVRKDKASKPYKVYLKKVPWK